MDCSVFFYIFYHVKGKQKQQSVKLVGVTKIQVIFSLNMYKATAYSFEMYSLMPTTFIRALLRIQYESLMLKTVYNRHKR